MPIIDLPLEEIESRAHKIQNNTVLQTRISDLLTQHTTNYPPNKYIEQTVYSGFPSDADSLCMERFHTAAWEDRANLLNGFDDVRYKELAERLLCSIHPERLTKPELIHLE